MTLCPDCGTQNLPGADLCESCSRDLTHLDPHPETEPMQQCLTQDSIAVLPLRPPLIVPPDTGLDTVIQMMREQAAGAVVIQEEGRITGIFTERDFLLRLALSDLDFHTMAINTVMTPSPVTVRLSHSLAFALREMALGRYRHLPVLDDHNQCTGILSADGILRYLIDRLESEASV